MTVRISDVIDPSLFTSRVQVLTEQKSAFISSGAFQRSPQLDAFLAGPGSKIDVHSYRDLDDSDENISSDDPAVKSTHDGIQTQTEETVRLSRNKSWKTMSLARELAHADPANAIANRVAAYKMRKLQACALAVTKGVFANNLANEDDMVLDISGSAYSAGVTNISPSALIDTTTSLGDSSADLDIIVMHSLPFANLQKQELIRTITPANGDPAFSTFIGRRVIVDDALAPESAGVYNTYVFGAGCFQFGLGNPTVPTEVESLPSEGNGHGGQALYHRWESCFHPTGMKYTGGSNPSNAVLETAGSWSRVFNERKAIKMCMLTHRES